MPFKGTDRDAYKKASRGRTKAQRSKIYYKEKAKNQKNKNSEKPKKVKTFSPYYYPTAGMSSKIATPTPRYVKPPTSIKPINTYKNNTKPKVNIKHQLKTTRSIMWDKTLNTVGDVLKDKILDFTLELIKENSNEELEKIIETYQTINKYVKIAKKIYKITVEIDKRINKFTVKYEQQPDNEFTQHNYQQDYYRHKNLYTKYESIANFTIVDLSTLEVWHLGKDKKQANKLFKLVLKGKKVATSYLYKQNEKLIIGDYSILTNWNKSKQLLIKTTDINVVPFNKVTKQHARAEGEGTKSLRYWRKVHKELFTEELKEKNITFTEDMQIVCEIFRIVKIIK